MPAETERKQELNSVKETVAFESRFEPHPWLRGGHLQTLAGNFLPREDHLPFSDERLFEVEDGVRVRCQCHWQPKRTETMTLMIVHGLEGSSASGYVIG